MPYESLIEEALELLPQIRQWRQRPVEFAIESLLYRAEKCDEDLMVDIIRVEVNQVNNRDSMRWVR